MGRPLAMDQRLHKIVDEARKEQFFIKKDYISRLEPLYFNDNDSGVVYTPEVYEETIRYAQEYGCQTIIDIGCGSGTKLIPNSNKYQIVGVDYGPNLETCRLSAPDGIWIEQNLESPQLLPISEDILVHSAIICCEVIEHLIDPSFLLLNLKHAMNYAPVCVLSTPERDLCRGVHDYGPPANWCHVREWNKEEFVKLLQHYEFNVIDVRLTFSDNINERNETLLVVLGK